MSRKGHKTSRTAPKGMSQPAWDVLSDVFGFELARVYQRHIAYLVTARVVDLAAVESVILLHESPRSVGHLRGWLAGAEELWGKLAAMGINPEPMFFGDHIGTPR